MYCFLLNLRTMKRGFSSGRFYKLVITLIYSTPSTKKIIDNLFHIFILKGYTKKGTQMDSFRLERKTGLKPATLSLEG